MGKITVRVITPKELAFTGEADEVILPGTAGRFTILPERAPVMAELESGKIVLKNGSKQDVYYITSGLTEASDNNVNIMVESVIAKDIVNVEALDEQMAKLQESKEKQTSNLIIKELNRHIAFIQMVKDDSKGL